MAGGRGREDDREVRPAQSDRVVAGGTHPDERWAREESERDERDPGENAEKQDCTTDSSPVPAAPLPVSWLVSAIAPPPSPSPIRSGNRSNRSASPTATVRTDVRVICSAVTGHASAKTRRHTPRSRPTATA